MSSTTQKWQATTNGNNFTGGIGFEKAETAIFYENNNMASIDDCDRATQSSQLEISSGKHQKEFIIKKLQKNPSNQQLNQLKGQ